MMMGKLKDNILKQLYDISQLDEPINLETIDDITPNRKLHTLYYNLLWAAELKLPKIDGIKSLLILLEYIYNKFNDVRKTPPHYLSRKNEILYLIIEQLLSYKIDMKDKETMKNIYQYFYEQDFFNCFLKIINKRNNSFFEEKFLFYSKVSYF